MSDRLRTGQREVYILPTRFGLLYAGSLLLTLLVSVNYNNGLGHLFSFLMASIGVVCMHYTQRNLVGLTLSARPGKAVFAGETTQLKVQVQDEIQRQRPNLWLRAEQQEQLFSLEAGDHRDIAVAVATHTRGYQEPPLIYLCTLYPLGIFLSWTRRLKADARLLVYPALGPEQPLPRGGEGEKELTDANTRSGIDDFAGIREHQPGDGLQRIHWRHSARGTGLKTKLFQGMGAGDLALRWQDTTASGNEERLSQLARWVYDAEHSGFRYGLELPGVRIAADNGPLHRHRCLKALALWQEA